MQSDIAPDALIPPPQGSRHILVRLLYLAPVLVVFTIAGAFVQRQNAEQQWLASAYAAADIAADAGDLVGARDAFTAISGYRDAASRAKEMEEQLRPLEAAYADGIQAIAQGDYATAVELLQPVAEQAPALNDVITRLEDARHLLRESLQREVDAAESIRDWITAERTWRQIISLDPTDAESRLHLAQLQRDHGPLALGNHRELWLVAPDGSEPRLLTDELQVIWPVWSPDRSQIAFLAPDPDDPMGNVALYAVSVDGEEPRRLADSVSAHAPPAWSPDGTRIAYTSFAGYDPIYESGSIGVRFVDVALGKETDLTGNDFSLAFNPSWSPDGNKIAFVVKQQGLGDRPQHSPGDAMMVEIGKEGFTDLTQGKVSDVWSVNWSPRGDSVLLYSLFGQTWYEAPSTAIRILDLLTEEIELIASTDEHPTMPVWAPDGTRLAFTVDENRVVIATTENDRETLETRHQPSGEMTWSPDGQVLLVAPWDADDASTMIDLSGTELDQSEVRLEFDSSPPFVSPPQWAPAAAIPPADNFSLPTAASTTVQGAP